MERIKEVRALPYDFDLDADLTIWPISVYIIFVRRPMLPMLALTPLRTR